MPASLAESRPPADFAVEPTPSGLALRACHRSDLGSLVVDWTSSELRRRIGGGRRQLLARAVGLHRQPGSRVIDATAGLGRDGFTLAALGAEVVLVERHPLIAALLRDARTRALAGGDAALRSAAERTVVVEADARDYLLEAAGRADAVHLDPMYPGDGKTALPQKGMQLLRELTRGDADAGALLAAALDSGIRRIALKRPMKAPWLDQRKPDVVMQGTQARYDVYLKA